MSSVRSLGEAAVQSDYVLLAQEDLDPASNELNSFEKIVNYSKKKK